MPSDVENVPYMLRHLSQDCGLEFTPREVKRLHADAQNQGKFKYQDLLSGICPKHKVDVMGWIGIDYLNQPVKYTGINEKKQKDWIDRYDTDLVGDGGRGKHSTVNGCIKDSKSGMYLYRDNIPVI